MDDLELKLGESVAKFFDLAHHGPVDIVACVLRHQDDNYILSVQPLGRSINSGEKTPELFGTMCAAACSLKVKRTDPVRGAPLSFLLTYRANGQLVGCQANYDVRLDGMEDSDLLCDYERYPRDREHTPAWYSELIKREEMKRGWAEALADLDPKEYWNSMFTPLELPESLRSLITSDPWMDIWAAITHCIDDYLIAGWNPVTIGLASPDHEDPRFQSAQSKLARLISEYVTNHLRSSHWKVEDLTAPLQGITFKDTDLPEEGLPTTGPVLIPLVMAMMIDANVSQRFTPSKFQTVERP